MKLIKQLNDNAKRTVAEDAGGAVGGGDVACAAMPLFSQLVKRGKPKKEVVSPPPVVAKKPAGLGLAEAFKALKEFEGDESAAGDQTPQDNFDTSEVIAKLKGLEQKEKVDQRDTVTFGLEDDENNLVRVTVRSEQAEDFERALQSLMAAREEEDDQVPEIAEVLFKLKDQFDIVDVQWPDVVEDEEEDMTLQGGDAEGMDAGGAEGDMDPNAEGDDLGGMEPPAAGGDTGQVTDLLTQVIDMMKADAEARKAEARAREAEAKTKEADALVAQSMARVKQEEQYLDMDSYNKAKKDEDKEAKRLAQLAKWKHDMGRDRGGDGREMDIDSADAPLVPNPDEVGIEQEERTYSRPAPVRAQPARRSSVVRGRVAPHDIAQFIIGRVK